jgi:hypothetical protein
MVAEARHEFRIVEERVRGWLVGPALLDALGALNSEVREALACERARLAYHGYANDLPLPALWWTLDSGGVSPRRLSS